MAANDRTNIPPAPAYFPTSADSPLHPPTALYTSLRSLSPDNDLTKTQDFVVSPRSGKAWTVPAGALFRLSTPEGPQVGDLNVWNQHDPREKFWASRTRQLQGSHVVQVGNVLTGASYDYHCHSNLVRSVLPYGLTEFDVHDVLNVFQVTGLDSQGRYFMEASPATKDSFLTFFAEQDLLCALSTCPGGDLSRWGWTQAEEVSGSKEKKEGDDDKGMKSTCRPIRVEVYEIKEAVKEKVLKGWKKPEKSGYRGMHGMGIPSGEA
ncbi:meiotic chromosome segregation protein [Alternaria alternata]|nr:meiotic chromosome segregation protein [Alternaria alternata]